MELSEFEAYFKGDITNLLRLHAEVVHWELKLEMLANRLSGDNHRVIRLKEEIVRARVYLLPYTQYRPYVTQIDSALNPKAESIYTVVSDLTSIKDKILQDVFMLTDLLNYKGKKNDV